MPRPWLPKNAGEERAGDVEIDARGAVLDEIQLAVEVGHGHPARAVGQFAQVVDTGVPPQPWIGDGPVRRHALREGGELLDGQPDAGGGGPLGDRVGDRFGRVGRGAGQGDENGQQQGENE
ncbi:hypothetical protein ACRJ4B_07225 [Streptomyces sp. GTA36]